VSSNHFSNGCSSNYCYLYYIGILPRKQGSLFRIETIRPRASLTRTRTGQVEFITTSRVMIGTTLGVSIRVIRVFHFSLCSMH